MWKFVIKQDGGLVAKGFGEEKDFIVNEACRYFCQYEDEWYDKMTMSIEKVKPRKKKGDIL